MQPNKLRGVKPGVSVHLTTGIVVLVVAIVFAACAKNSNQTGNAPQSSTGQPASSTPTPTPTPEKILVPGDTIIVIRDGSVQIAINKGLCNDDSSAEFIIYKCAVDLDAATIRNEKSHPPKRCPKVDKDSQITIDGGGERNKITIQRDEDRKVEIKFRRSIYPPCVGDPDNYCGINNVRAVIIDSKREDCDPAEKCEISVHKK